MTVKADKSLGQHFLKNPEIIQQICNQFQSEYDNILEIGPGPATLTKELVKKEKPLFLVELDTRFKEILEGLSPAPKIFFQDALSFDPKQDDELFSKNTWLVSNLPYNISAPLLLKFLTWKNVNQMTLMFQKEVGEKVLDGKKISSLYCMVRSFFTATTLIKLKPGAFHPPPDVHSIVINFKRKDHTPIPLDQIQKFESFLRPLFSQKRKQMVGLLKGQFPKAKILQTLRSLSISETIRAEDLSLENVHQLYHTLNL